MAEVRHGSDSLIRHMRCRLGDRELARYISQLRRGRRCYHAEGVRSCERSRTERGRYVREDARSFPRWCLAASPETEAALTKGHLIRLHDYDEAKYGKVICQPTYVAPYSGFSCFGLGRYSIIHAPGEPRVLRSNGIHNQPTSVFFVNPSGG